MKANLVSIAGGVSPQSRENAVATLREFAQKIESGNCTDFVALFFEDGIVQYRRWCTPLNAIAMTAMAQAEAIDELRR